MKEDGSYTVWIPKNMKERLQRVHDETGFPIAKIILNATYRNLTRLEKAIAYGKYKEQREKEKKRELKL